MRFCPAERIKIDFSVHIGGSDGMVPTVLHVVYCTRLTMDTMHNMHSTVGIDTPAVCILRVKHTYFKHTYELVPS